MVDVLWTLLAAIRRSSLRSECWRMPEGCHDRRGLVSELHRVVCEIHLHRYDIMAKSELTA